ncbi:MAG: hypothetical protein ACYDHU_10710 [Acidimicrobiales bacterium]
MPDNPNTPADEDAELAELYGSPPKQHAGFSEIKRRMAAGLDDTMAEAPVIPEVLHWPDIPPDEIESAWEDLRAWVTELLARFAWIDHHVVPDCWWRHSELVELLSALRGHEQMAFLPGQPPTAAADWFRAMRDLLGMARAWVAESGCAAGHIERPSRVTAIDPDDWAGHLESVGVPSLSPLCEPEAPSRDDDAAARDGATEAGSVGALLR